MKKNIIFFLIIAIFAMSLAGCSDEWRRKFIRKKKETKKPRIYQLKKYKKEPTRALYDKHYNYAISWLTEMTDGLGENNKKDLRCIEEALAQIKDMQNFLIPEKAQELDKHINRLKEIRDTVARHDLGHANKDYVQRSLDREERFLRSEFYYNKVKKFMKESFDGSEEP